MSQEVNIEEVFNELQTTPEGRQQLELATLRAIIKNQQAQIQNMNCQCECCECPPESIEEQNKNEQPD
tara:strand:- start:232 stop:435 length:204 start_codon:yes stop_codon:yes gene_type:complete